MTTLCCLSLTCDKFILPASWTVHLSVCLQLPSFRHTRWQRGPGSPRWLTPKSPPTANPSPSRGLSGTALSHYVGEMFGGLCVPSYHTVSQHNASLWASSYCGTLFVSVCVMVFLFTTFPPAPAGILLQSLKQGLEGGGYWSPEGVYANAWLKCHFISAVNKIPPFVYMFF